MILTVARYWPTLTETFVYDEVQALRARGVDVRVVALGQRGDPHTEPDPGPVLRRPHRAGWLAAAPDLLAERARGPVRAPTGQASSPLLRPENVLWLAAMARSATLVHVHFAGDAAALTRAACARAGVPYAVTVHAVDLWKPRADLAAILGDAALVTTISDHAAGVLHARHGVRARVLRCGVPDAAFVAPRRAVPSEVLSVGRWVPKKGLDLLAAVAAEIPARVRLVSDAPPLPGVDVLGPRPRAEVRQLLARASVFALPCRVAPDGDRDGIPVVLLEAMAAAVPVVTTPVSGIPELVDASVGWLVPPDDPRALVAAIRSALADPDEAARRGADGRARVRGRGLTAAERARALADAFAVVVGRDLG